MQPAKPGAVFNGTLKNIPIFATHSLQTGNIQNKI